MVALLVVLAFGLVGSFVVAVFSDKGTDGEFLGGAGVAVCMVLIVLVLVANMGNSKSSSSDYQKFSLDCALREGTVTQYNNGEYSCTYKP